MKRCTSCDTLNSDKNRFCVKCGEKLPDEYLCPKCGENIDPNDKFCKKCGQKIKRIQKPKKNERSKIRISLIAVGAFIGFLLLIFVGLYLFARFYIMNKYALVYSLDGVINVISREEGPSFGELFVCKDIDERTLAPLNISNQFKAGQRSIYASIYVYGVNQEDGYSFKIRDKNTDEEIIDYGSKYFSLDGYYVGYVPLMIKIAEEDNIADYRLLGEVGEFEVEYYHNDYLVDEAEFEMLVTPIEIIDHIIFETFDEENFSHVNINTEYDYNTQQLISGVYLKGTIKENDRFIFHLVDNKFNEIIKKYEGNYSDLISYEYIDKYLYFYLFGTISDEDVVIDPGNYRVDFYHNNDLVSTVDFNIIG